MEGGALRGEAGWLQVPWTILPPTEPVKAEAQWEVLLLPCIVLTARPGVSGAVLCPVKMKSKACFEGGGGGGGGGEGRDGEYMSERHVLQIL